MWFWTKPGLAVAVFALAALALLPGCGGGDSADTTANELQTTVATGGNPQQPAQHPPTKADEQRKDKAQAQAKAPAPEVPSPGHPLRRRIQRSPYPKKARALARRFRQRARQGGHPLLRCLRRYGAPQGGNPQQSSHGVPKPSPELRKCVRRKLGFAQGRQ
jgi:hypothetical protein